MTFLLKTYQVLVNGFPEWLPYEGATPGQARARAWRSYCSYRDVSFREFLRISTIKRAPDPEGFGQPILVSGRPAYRVGRYGQYVRFVRPNETIILNSHPLDVEQIP